VEIDAASGLQPSACALSASPALGRRGRRR
jgi:hypothetical protein